VIYANGPMLRMTHYEGDGSATFVFDMMEPERPKVDLAVLSQIGGVASGGFHDKGGWGREAQSAVREAGGGAGTLPLLRPRQLNEVPGRSAHS
jgi:hypothetical protein